MIILKETAGDTLQGAIDGLNTVFEASYDFGSDYVNVYLNGRLKIPAWDDGFTVSPPRTVDMKEAPLSGDSLEVEYASGIATGGGAEGGIPDPPILTQYKPGMDADEHIPDMSSDELEPKVSSEGTLEGEVFSYDLKPVIVSSEER